MQQTVLAFETRRTPGQPRPGAGPADIPRFSLYREQWWSLKSCEWRPSTQALNRCFVERYLVPAFGAMRVDQITRTDLQRFRADLLAKGVNANNGQKLGPATVNRCVQLLRQILGEASLQYGFANPTEGLRTLRTRKPWVSVFSLEQTRRIIAAAPMHWRPYLTVRFFCGLRAGEINGLGWSHVDFEKGQLMVRQSYSNGHIGETKNPTSDRCVQLSRLVLDALQQQRSMTDGRSEFVFLSARGEPVDNRNFDRRVWRPLLKQLGLPDCRPHVMRHTCASLWLSAGENPEWIAKQLGHANTETLFRVYSRFVPDVTRRDGSAMERLLEASWISFKRSQVYLQLQQESAQ